MDDLGITGSELKALLRKRPGVVALKTFVLVGSWAALGYLALGAPWWGRVLLWMAMGFAINGLVQLAHETWHGNLLPRRWQNTAAGTLLGLAVGIAHGPMRHDHLAHHKYNRTERDPDAYNVGRPSFWPTLLHYTIAIFGLPLSLIYFNILYPIQYYERPALRRHALVLLGYVAFHVALWSWLSHSGLVSTALVVWVIPVLFTSPFNGLKSLADHYANDWRGVRYRTATTVRTNRLVEYAWNGLNYHLDHHLFPRVPGYNLPALHRYLRPALLARNAPLFDGYLKVMFAALAAGPMVVDEDVRVVTLERKR